MRKLIHCLFIFFSLTLMGSAQLDDRLVGRWQSSTGAVIDIAYPKVGNGSYTLMTINKHTKLSGNVEYGDMDP